MITSAPTITIHHANLAYQHTPLFSDLNLTILGGQCTCLLGPSGVGKSSLLRLIAGLTVADSNLSENQIPSNIIETNDHLPLHGRIAYMAQNDLLMPWLTILENILLGAKLRGDYYKNKQQYEKLALHLLDKVGLAKVLHQRPDSLSGGMKQRVALARTLFENRPVVLMDEPFSSLDMITRLRLQDLAAELLIDRTVLLVTHDPFEALRIAHRIHIMSGLPAKLDNALVLSGAPPRDLSDTNLLQLQALLLERLRSAHEVNI